MRCRPGDLAYHRDGYIVNVVEPSIFPDEWFIKYQSFMVFVDGVYQYGSTPDSWLTPIRGGDLTAEESDPAPVPSIADLQPELAR